MTHFVYTLKWHICNVFNNPPHQNAPTDSVLTSVILKGIELAFRKIYPTKIPGMVHQGLLAPQSLYIPVTLSVDFRCPDSKVSRLVCSNIPNSDMLTYQTAKCSFTFYQRHSFMLDQFPSIFSLLPCLTSAFHVYILLIEI